MGRPKKEVENAEPFGAMPDDVQESAMPAVNLKELKPCPKCGEKATAPYKDSHGHWRCNCSHPKCGFWDSMCYDSANDAAMGWQLAGGPDKSLW